MQNFDLGDQVTVIGQTMGGRFIIEGVGWITDIVDGDGNRYMVDFHDELQPGSVERFVDVQAQDDPSAFVEFMNESIAQAKADEARREEQRLMEEHFRKHPHG